MDRIFQPFANWFQKLTGKDCFFLAYVATYMYLGFGLCTDYCHKNSLVIGFGAALSSIVTLITTLWILFLVSYSKINYRGRGNTESIYANAARISNPVRLLRQLNLIIYLGFSPTFVILVIIPTREMLYGKIATSALTATFFFASCTPLPTQKSKVKEWVEQLKSAVQYAGKTVVGPVWQPDPAKA